MSIEKVERVKIKGELLKRFLAHKKSEDRSANYILIKALEKYLPKLKKK
jgi:hypothetical protein